MNQILYTGSPQKKPASIKSILRFFSVSLIIIGVVFIIKSSYTLFQNNSIGKGESNTSVPSIAFDQEVNNAIVTISHVSGISKVKYNWEGQEPIIKQGNSQKNIILDNISIPKGINTLYVTAIDENGKTSESSFSYKYNGISIEFSVVDNTYIKITATDVTGLSYITYRWNSNENIIAYPSEEDNTIVEVQTEIPSGLNTLYITAINKENKTLTKNQEVKGNHPPKIQVYQQGNDLLVMISDEEGIDKITYNINGGEDKIIDADGKNEYNYKYEIAEGQNVLVKITAVDVEGIERTFYGKNY